MIQRDITAKLLQLAGKFPVVSLTGPRQSGKTTLLKNVFPGKAYVSLEDIDVRQFATDDPRGFLATYPHGAILDEVQRAPDLFSYLQAIVDEHNLPGEFILSGSQNFLLMQNISQSLAGRIAVLKLLPFSNKELSSTEFANQLLEERIFTGAYPRIYDKHIEPADFYSAYIQTYIERDIRLLKNIHDLNLFSRFLKLCAARTGQLLNISSLAADCGISHFTAQAWLSLLQSSYIVYLLTPHHENFSKRLTKMPKLYFYDTGLASYLLNITESKQLQTHYMRGPLFENLIITELLKHYSNKGKDAPCYFWRDKTGHEIDCLLDLPDSLKLIEIKSALTFHTDFLKNLTYFQKLNQGKYNTEPVVIYAGSSVQKRETFTLLPWNSILFSE
jgi:hypothetical protein